MSDDNLIGQQLGSFRLESEIGSGAMGVVYRGTYLKTNQPAAVKVILGGYLGRGNAGERFEREAEILHQFRHPNIVRLLAYGRSKKTPYIGMEFIEGQTLEDLLRKEELLPWPEVVRLAIQVCDALQYAHERGVVHRDLKPSNLMVTPESQIKLTDFGIAKDLDATALTAPNRTLGTAAYMAPEQIRGHRDISHKTDLYSLGCVLYQMLTGQPPFRGTGTLALMNAHLNTPPPRPSKKTPQIPLALDDLVVTLMAKSVTDRPWDAQAVSENLKQIDQQMRRGEPIKMVFGPPYISPEANLAPDPNVPTLVARSENRTSPSGIFSPPSFEATSSSAPVRKKKPKKKRKPGDRRLPRLGTLSLVAGLLGVVGLLTFLLWPPSAEKLYSQALPLMQSTDPLKWEEADTRYLVELDRRFPGHEHTAEVTALRDQIRLTRARNRGQRLLRGLLTSKSETEELYLRTSKVADAAIESLLDNVAAIRWNEMADQLEREANPDDRGWALLARSHAKELIDQIEGRRREVAALLTRATRAEDEASNALTQEEADSKIAMATNLRRQVLQDFGRYPYLTDLVAFARASLDAAGVDLETPQSTAPNSATPPQNPSSELK